MAKVIISPYSARLRSGNRNPKNFPHFAELVAKLNANGHEILQIGVSSEERIEGIRLMRLALPFYELCALVNEADTWISVDNFFPHFCHCERLKSGIVIFGKSSPQIFGYPDNENLFLSANHFRPFQFAHWEEEPYDPNVFPPVMQVVWAVERKLKASRKPEYVGIF